MEAPNASRRNRKPRLYAFDGALESVAWFWRVAGLFPFTIKGPIAARRYEINKFHVIYSLLVFLLCSGTFVNQMIRYTLSFNDNRTLITAPIKILLALTGYPCLILAYIWRIIRHKKLSKTINKMREQYVILQRLSCLDCESNIKIIRAYAGIVYGIIAFLTSYKIYASIGGRDALTTLQQILPIIALATRIINISIFVALVGAIGLKFRAINEKIKSVATRANASSSKISLTSDDCAKIVRLLSAVHFNLCKIGKRINRIFDWLLILDVANTFIISSTVVYHILFEFLRDDGINYGKILSHFVITITFNVQIIAIVVVCNWTSRQAIQTGKLVHEIRVEAADCKLYGAVESFSLQLYHQNLKFNAGGFFPMNSTLLLMMAKSLTTYLVILIQFRPNVE